MQATPAGVSDTLAAAQEKLKALQQQRRAERLAQALPVYTDEHGRPLANDHRRPTAGRRETNDLRTILRSRPHLGWESNLLSVSLRKNNDRQPTADHCQESTNDEQSLTNPHPSSFILHPLPNPPAVSGRPSAVRLYPDLALALLRHHQAAAGRLWLLLQGLEANHCGWLNIEEARQQLTIKTSPTYLCGWRQLRKLLAQGDGLFWQRDDTRLWLRSTAKVAAALGVQHLTGRPITLPVQILLQGIGAVRAHFYASFHSGRTHRPVGSRHSALRAYSVTLSPCHPVTLPTPAPIARATLSKLSGVGRRTQAAYEKRAGVRSQHNIAIGEKATPAQLQERAWQHGRALFRLTDKAGRRGQPGATYLAWQLPNTYIGPHQPQSRGRQKRINRELADLFHKGITGNGRPAVEKRFYGNGLQAAKGYQRAPQNDAYWRDHHRPGRAHFWHVLAAQEKR